MPKTFDDFDQLDLSDFSERLTSFIQTERHFVEGALIISLNGKFGCGKSTFFEMWRQRLKQKSSDQFSTILMNAWNSDFDRDPLLSIVQELVVHFEKNGEEAYSDSLKETAGKLGKFALSLGNDAVAKITGLDFQKAGEKAEPRKPGLSGKACFQLFEERQNIFSHLKHLLAEAVKKEAATIVIMVDELDRCRPDHAVEYLETIKHIFDVEGLVFILGVDKTSLSSSVRSLYGASLDFDEYYRKFVHRNIAFPKPTLGLLQRFGASLVQRYLKSDALATTGRFHFAEWDRYRVENLAELFEGMQLSLRQIHEVFRLLAHCLNCPEEQHSRMLWGWQIGTIFMATMSVAKPEIYQQWGRDEVNTQTISDLLVGCKEILEQERNTIWWTALICLGTYGHNEQSEANFKTILEALKIWDSANSEDFTKKRMQEMSKAYDFFGMRHESSRPYVEIYKKIEGVRKFGRD